MSILHFLGRGAAFNTAEKNTSAYAAEGSRLLLLDCGETVFSELQRRGLLNGVTEIYVALSHLHSDHCGSVGTLWHYCRFMLDIPLNILLPSPEICPEYAADVRTLLRLYGEDGKDLVYLRDREMPPVAGITGLRYVRTEHADGIPCFSFVLETAGGGIFYSADTRTVRQLLEFMDSHPSFEHACMDCSETDYPGNVHLALDKLAAVVPPEKRGRFSLMHLTGPGCIEKGRLLGFECADCS